jgi:uncharacterized protein
MTKLGITPQQAEIVKSFFPAEYNIYFFGSRIKGGWREYSDLDICIKNAEKIDMGELSFISEKFANSDLPFTVDIVDYQRCDESFKKIIDLTGLSIHLVE